MADEAVIVDRIEHPLNFTVTNATGIEKGALLKLTDPRTAIITSGVDDVLAGINAREKIASDARTSTPVFRRGVFRMVASGSITVADAVSASALVNRVWSSLATVKSGSILGHSLETVTDGQTVHIDVNVGSGGNQVS